MRPIENIGVNMMVVYHRYRLKGVVPSDVYLNYLWNVDSEETISLVACDALNDFPAEPGVNRI